MEVIGFVPSKSSPAKFYRIIRSDDGVVRCECPAWKFQKVSPAARVCKHIVERASNWASRVAVAS